MANQLEEKIAVADHGDLSVGVSAPSVRGSVVALRRTDRLTCSLAATSPEPLTQGASPALVENAHLLSEGRIRPLSTGRSFGGNPVFGDLVPVVAEAAAGHSLGRKLAAIGFRACMEYITAPCLNCLDKTGVTSARVPGETADPKRNCSAL